MDKGGFEYFQRDGKVSRRAFVKGVGMVTVASAMGFDSVALAEEGPQALPAGAAEGDVEVSGFCSYNCNSACQITGILRDGKLIGVRPHAVPGREDYANCCLRGVSFIQRIQDEASRTMYPMKRVGERGSGEWERITWDEAIATIAEKLQAVVEKDPKRATFYPFTGDMAQLSWTAEMRFANQIGATIWTMEGIMGDHGASMGMVMAYGAQRAGHDTRDYMNSDLFIYWGGNSFDTHTSEARYILDARDNGAKMIVIDPRLSSTASLADQWVPIKPKTDPVLALAMTKVIIDRGMQDETWLKNYSCAPLLVSDETGLYIHPSEGMYAAWDEATDSLVELDPALAGGPDDGTSGPESTLALTGSFEVNGEKCHPTYVDLLAELERYDLAYASEVTGIEAEVIEQLAIEYASAKSAGIRFTQGITRVNYSFMPFRAIATLAAVCGNIGKPGGGAGHIWAQGNGNPLMPVEASAPLPDYREWDGDGMPPYLAAVLCGGLEHKSSDFYESAITGENPGVDFLFVATSNLLNQSPDLNYVVNEVLPAIDFIVVADPFWTLTAKYADIVLPASTTWENWDINSKPPWLQLNQPRIQRMGESKSDTEMMTMLAPYFGLQDSWQRTDEEWVESFLNVDHPGIASFDWEQFKQDGIYGRDDGIYEPCYSWGDKKFGTASGRMEFYTESMVPYGCAVPAYMPAHEDPQGELGGKYPLVFLQYHDKTNINSQNILAPALRAVATEPLLSMHPKDAEARGISHGDVVRVFNDRGSCKVHVFCTEGIVPGAVAMPSSWTPDYFIEGHYQQLTHYKRNDAEEAFSQSNAAFYDVLVEVEKA